MVEEKITCKHFAQGLVKPKTHIKAFSFVCIILFWGLIGYGIWKAFFKKPEPTTAIKAEAGSTVKVTNINKSQRFLIPFIEVGIEQQRNSDLETYIRGGVRIEF